MRYIILSFFVFFCGFSVFTKLEQPKVVGDQKSSVQTAPTPIAPPISDLLPTTAKIEFVNLSLNGCLLNFSQDEKSLFFDFGFKGICGFEQNPDKMSESRIVKTPNGSVLTVIGFEKIKNHKSSDKPDQPCNIKVRWVIVRDDNMFVSNKTSEKPNSCVTQLDEKDYLIFSKDSITLEQAEKDNKPVSLGIGEF